jgi:hypothetical protein
MRATLVILAAAGFDRDFNFVVTGVIDREQDTSIRFVGDQPKQLSLLIVLLDEGQSASIGRRGDCSWLRQPQR